MMLSDTSSSSSDSDYDSSSTLDLADRIYVLLNEGINNGPGPKKPPIMVDPRMLSRRSGRLEGILKSPPRKLTKNQMKKNQMIAARNRMVGKNMQQPNKYGRKSTTDDNILTFNAADERRALNILPKDDVKADEPKKKVSVTIDKYAHRSLNIPPKDDARAAEPKKKISVSAQDNRRSMKPVHRSAVQR